MLEANLRKYRDCVGLMILNSQNKIFTGQRTDFISGAWQMPQGGIDEGESCAEAAFRELKEETGLDGKEPKLLMVMGDADRDPRKHIVSIVYEIQVSEQQQPVAGDDAADARFWPISTLLSGEVEFAGDHLTILKNWLNQ